MQYINTLHSNCKLHLWAFDYINYVWTRVKVSDTRVYYYIILHYVHVPIIYTCVIHISTTTYTDSYLYSEEN